MTSYNVFNVGMRRSMSRYNTFTCTWNGLQVDLCQDTDTPEESCLSPKTGLRQKLGKLTSKLSGLTSRVPMNLATFFRRKQRDDKVAGRYDSQIVDVTYALEDRCCAC